MAGFACLWPGIATMFPVSQFGIGTLAGGSCSEAGSVPRPRYLNRVSQEPGLGRATREAVPLCGCLDIRNFPIALCEESAENILHIYAILIGE